MKSSYQSSMMQTACLNYQLNVDLDEKVTHQVKTTKRAYQFRKK